MEWIINSGGVENIPRYNCSAHTAEEWTAQDGVKHPYFGVGSIVFGVIVEVLYGLCMMVVVSKELFALSCFKIMFFLGIVDMAAIVINSLIHGYLLIIGGVFCTHPTLIFISGLFGVGFWCIGCMLCLILVVNRILEIWRSDFAHLIFHGYRTYFIVLPSFLYGAYFIFFTSPVLFTSKYQSWFFDPFIFENRTMEYQNLPHSANNFFLVGCTCSLYIFFCMALGHKIKHELTISTGAQRAHNQIFLQSSIICLVNMGASVIYVIMNFIPVPHFIIILGHIAWQLGQGCPPFIYLGMNRTIRNKLLKKLGLKKNLSKIAASTTHRTGSRLSKTQT